MERHAKHGNGVAEIGPTAPACWPTVAFVTEDAVRQRIAEGVNAIRARDLDALTARYARDVVSFDLGAPLRYAGDDNKRRA